MGALGSTRAKLLVTTVAVGGFASVAGLGTFGSFTSSTSASADYSSGTVAIEIGAAGTATNRLTVGASNLVPGDTIQRAVDLTNKSTAAQPVTLTTTATTSSVLDTDATNGLQVAVDRCSAVWTESTSAPYTYTCSGTTSTVLASRAVIGSNLALAGLTAGTAAGVTDHLRVTLTFPTAADNSFQGKSSTIKFAFDATQRTAGAQ